MPGTRTRVKPVSAAEPSASDEASLLEIHLQRQLEEDIARIFDESIYSDLEVVCGKLKILTHSCILKARTNEFYHKLQTILHVNIGRSTFDEIYSFVSDVYTECNIRNQEKEILAYLNETFKVIKVVPKNKADSEDAEVFLTPKCLSPYIEKGQKTIGSSPSTELTKEYYALVPIDGNLLEKELIEQDALSNAFHSIIKTQSDNLKRAKSSQCSKKPTSLSLSSSHTSKIVKHSNSCDILFKCHGKDNVGSEVIRGNDIVCNGAVSITFSSQTSPTAGDDKVTESAYSPDSLITDEPSSSSDYLSAAYAFSPGASSSAALPPLNVGEYITKMENVFTSSDSGLENTGLMESLSSHKDVTLTDLSLTESTLHDLTIDDTHYFTSSPVVDNHPSHKVKAVSASNASSASTHSHAETNGQKINQSNKHRDAGCCKSSKEEKQRQNEEIFIMESSSLSSETGSWESVFPPKLAERELCERFLKKERQHTFADDVKEDLCPSLVQKSPFKSTSCFIDAASLADEEDDTIKIQVHPMEPATILNSHILPTPSQPVPCATSKHDISPSDWSESNDNEDSLEQPENKDPESAHKDLSPTIFEMTPITEDSLCVNDEPALRDQPATESITATVNEDTSHQPHDKNTSVSSTIFVTSTPHNSIMSLNVCTVKQYNSEESRIDLSTSGYESLGNMKKLQKFNESSPIVSGGASIEDYLPLSSSHSDSPMPRRRIENIPIVSGAYVPPVEEDNYRKSPKPSSFASAWVVDMSMSPKSDGEKSTSNSQFIAKKPGDRACESLKNECISINDNLNKSRSSLDSDSSERSSHKFYIDLSCLPDPLPPKNDHEVESSSEKKNIFSMYIDLGEKSTLKEMPARLSCSLNSKKHTTTDVKPKSVATKAIKGCTDNFVSPAPNNKESNSPGTFEKYETLCNDLNISISEIIRCPATETTTSAAEINNSITPDPVKKVRPSRVSGVDKSSFQRDVVIHEEPTGIDQSGDLFVKLSDLDKPAPKSDATIITTMYDESVSNVRMTRSIPDNNWGNQSGSISRPIDITSSFHSENALSLNRLFPHLKNEFSKSMPGSLPSKGRGRASGRETDEPASDVSVLSSVQSSVCRSVVENSTTEETTSQTSSLIGFCQSRLGQDLLRMFLEEITPDVIVEVSGRRIKAHKCILSSRCQYFARILSGGWVESAGNVIVLPPFSYNVVHFALCHIYSGVSRIPDAISIVELATLADMLGLEGLKEAIMFTLKANYCHHFHRPCAVCTAGVLECFPLSSVYSLDDLYRKCLKWITKYFSRVWPTKAFATLPKELLDKCYQQHIINLTTDNLVDTVFGCAITVESLQNSRWAECVARMCRRLVNAAAHFAAPRLVAVLRGVRAAAPAPASPAASQALHDCIAAAIEWAPSDEAARAYAFLSALPVDEAAAIAQRSRPDLIADGARHPPPPPAGDLLLAHAASWRVQCEGALVRAAPRAVLTQAFKELPPELRKRLRELGCIMYGPQVVPAASPLHDRKSRSAYHARPGRGPAAVATRSLDMDHVRESFVPYSPRPSAHLGSVDTLKSNGDLRDRKPIKMMTPKIRTTKAQEERAKYNMVKTNQSQDRLAGKGGRQFQLFENTKPRYLEPRMYKESEKKSPATKKLVNKMISSSESSRNSSPIQARLVRASRESALSQDSLASASRPRTAEPSTDSLSESQNTNKYATYTKRKYTAKGSVESIQSSKFQNALNNKIKTKIPVYLNQSSKSQQASKQLQPGNNTEPQRRVNQPNKTVVAGNTQRRALVDRKVPGSLMNATKSSQAKMVTKTAKEKQAKPNTRSTRAGGKHASRQEHHEQAADIPVMQRSGTFLKDEPTFGDITTHIDVDQ